VAAAIPSARTSAVLDAVAHVTLGDAGGRQLGQLAQLPAPLCALPAEFGEVLFIVISVAAIVGGGVITPC